MTENGLEVCAHDVIGVIDRTNAELDHSTTPRSAGSCRCLARAGQSGIALRHAEPQKALEIARGG
jgi:hypothetical protein